MGLELLTVLQSQLGDLGVPLAQGFLQFRDTLFVSLLQGMKLLPQFEALLVNLHDPGGGQMLQVWAVVAIGTIKTDWRFHAAAHELLRLQGEDLPIQVGQLLNQSLERLVARRHPTNLLHVLLADMAAPRDSLVLEGEIEAGPLGSLGRDRADEDVQVCGDSVT